MKNLLIVFTIFSLTACTSSDDATDTAAPIISLLGTNPVDVFIGKTYTDAGASASDAEDGDITANIETVNSVDPSIAGTYAVTYNVSDAAGNAATEVTRTVNVISIEQVIIGNWIVQFTDSEGSYNSRITIIESGEMSAYTEATLSNGDVMSSIEGKTWTLAGDQLTTVDTYEDDSDTLTVTVISQDSISILNGEGETLNLTRTDAYESSLVGEWEGISIGEDCTTTEQISFTSSNEFSAIITNADCDDETELVAGTYTNSSVLSGTLSLIDVASSQTLSAYYAVQGDKLTLLFEGSDETSVLDKQ